ncbi:MAG: class I SAM-dependent methyltransferase [Actinobacteria bacterium]|nr:class I SAM-dependent methyltransferase [Actinomycetota bacterium]
MPKLNRLERMAVKSRFSRRWSGQAARSMILGLQVPAHPAIVEIGCGPAAALFEAIKMLKPSLAIGMDTDEKMIEAARTEAAKIDISPVKLMLGQAEDLPLAPSSIDLVIGFEVLHHVGDWHQAVREIARVLKPGGHFLSREAFNPTRARWFGRLIHRIPKDLTRPNYIDFCRNAGLSPESTKTSFLHGEYIFGRE